MIVWVVEDEKYGTQGVFKTEELANLAVDADEVLCPSGSNPVIMAWEVEE